ncbi:hypothetical protein [Streptomyces sp. NPDC001404]|uniref:hypothetical protein n=1 Tax=Streptomyces sp. NPDC001404 TaxID=3364571 RepID=UPI0036C9366D
MAVARAEIPWIVSALVSVCAILAAVIKAGRWTRSVEDRLARHQADLEGLGDAVAALRNDEEQP